MNVSFNEEETRVISKFLHAMEKEGSDNLRGLKESLDRDDAQHLIDSAMEGERFLDEHQEEA